MSIVISIANSNTANMKIFLLILFWINLIPIINTI